MREKHGAKLPENLSVQDWGVTYDELEPLYWRAEQMMGIGGKAGNLRGQKIEGGNLFEGPRQHEYPNPPHKMTALVRSFRRPRANWGTIRFPRPRRP